MKKTILAIVSAFSLSVSPAMAQHWHGGGYHGGYHHGGGHWGGGAWIPGAILGGALLGGALAAPTTMAADTVMGTVPDAPHLTISQKMEFAIRATDSPKVGSRALSRSANRPSPAPRGFRGRATVALLIAIPLAARAETQIDCPSLLATNERVVTVSISSLNCVSGVWRL
jgi:hypothetical protein